MFRRSTSTCTGPSDMKGLLRRRSRPLTKRGSFSVTCVLLALGAACAACSSGTTGSLHGSARASHRARTLTSVTIGNGIVNGERLPIWIAQAKGYFASRGLHVSIANLTDSTLTSTVISGSVDYAQSNVSLFVRGIAQGIPLMAVQNSTDGLGVALIVTTQFANAHSITSTTPVSQVVHDLVGSTGGFSSPVTKGEANVLLASYGVTPSQVTEASFSAVSGVEAAFKKNQIEWFVTGQPGPAILQAHGDGLVVATRFNAPAWASNEIINQVIMASQSFLASHTAMTQNLLAALQKANTFINSHPNQSATIMRDNIPGLSTSAALTALKSTVWPSSGAFNSAMWKKTVSFLVSAGEVPSTATVPANTYTNKYIAKK